MCGPPAAGKSTYVREHAAAEDVVIDLDSIATALRTGTPSSVHDYPQHVRAVAIAAREAAIREAAALHHPVTTWLIHTQPTAEHLAEYAADGWDVITIDPGRETVRERAASSDRPAGAIDAIDRWYGSQTSASSSSSDGRPAMGSTPDMGERNDDMTIQQNPALGGQQGTDHGAGAGVQGGGQQQGGGATQTDRGFPPNTPIADMTDAERANYFKFHNRQAETRLEGFKGVTPEDVTTMQNRIAELERERLSEQQRAAADAAAQAQADARAAADAEWRPKYQAQQLKAIAAGGGLTGDRLTSFLATANPAAFANEAGDIDEAKVQQHLTAMFGTSSSDQRHDWGQNGDRPPAKNGRELALAEAERRGYIKKEKA
ncbi:AAA family ATPase [Tsukamurella ocularis]|uniref:AAA family ATPase n=1 Tax=Tsukamurella ocularis TaxID=1970234 RepID=UPI0039F0FDAB